MKKAPLIFIIASFILAGCTTPITPVDPEPEPEKEEKLPITSFVMSESEKDLKVGSTFELSVTVTPSEYSEGITWKSDDASIASVSNTGVVTANKVGSTVISATSSDKQFTATCNVNVKDIDSWTVMIYLCGSDLESASRGGGLATSDLREILSVTGQPDDVNIIIQTGGAKKWKSTYGISSTKLERWHVENQKLVKDQSLKYASMGSSSTLESFLTWGLENYPAEKTGLVLWNHGGGLTGCCFDEKANLDSLTHDEVDTALEGAFTTAGVKGKLEFIGYDCCLMQVQDIAEINSKYFNYMVASEEAESGYGWDYDTWVGDLYNKRSTSVILKAICDGFIADNDNTGYANDQTLSILDLSKMDAYREAFESFALKLGKILNSSNKKNFRTLIRKAKTYAKDSDGSHLYYGLFDAKDVLSKIKADTVFNPGDDAIKEVEDAFAELVYYSKKGSSAGNSYGLALVWGVSSDSQMVYEASVTNFTVWQKLSNEFGGQ